MSLFSRACLALLLVGACASEQQSIGNNDVVGSGSGSGSGSSVATGFTRIDLVSNNPDLRPRRVDADVVNAWGMVASQGAFWISNNGSGKVSIFDGAGLPARTRTASGSLVLGEGITGVAENKSSSFQIHTAANCAAAQLIFSSEKGQLIAVNTDLLPSRGMVVVDRSAVGASYKGVAIIQMDAGMRILAADFHNGRIDVFDQNFQLLSDTSLFVDAKLATGMAPFNVALLNGKVYIAYAMQDADKADEVAGAGLGVVAEFDLTGKLLREVVTGGMLNAPWGMAMAPSDFCKSVANALLVGNFGDGHIIAVELDSGRVIGALEGNVAGQALVIDGLWGLVFAPADAKVSGAAGNALYFTAGPNDEADGLFGVLTANE